MKYNKENDPYLWNWIEFCYLAVLCAYQFESYYTNTTQFLAAISNVFCTLWLMKCTVLNRIYFSTLGAESDPESGLGLTLSLLEPDSIETAQSQIVLLELKETENNQTVVDKIMG